MNKQNNPSPAKQKGAVLLISLLIMIVLTVIGVTGLSNTNLEERMSHNFQQTTIAYQGAESAIQNVLLAGNPETEENPNYDDDADPLISAVNAGANVVSTSVSFPIPDTDVATNTDVVYIAPAACPGSSFGTIVCYVLEARATASISATNTTTRHVQGIRRPGAEDSSTIIH